MTTPPRASVIVPAFNLAHYLPAAIDSALAQHPPGGPVQVIVVDDGSTDDTPEVLARYGERIEVIRQPNGGLVSAVDRGLQAVRGEYVGLLDADDEWPADRLRRHVGILESNPNAGLVHGDMEVIDAGGATVHPSFFAWKQEHPPSGRVLTTLAKDNFVSGGASTFRASLLPAIQPIASAAAYPDWWIAVAVAAVAEIVYDPVSANRYRYHGANMGLGADRSQVLAIERRELPFRRWMTANLLGDECFGLREVGELFVRWRQAVLHAGLSTGGRVRALPELEADPAAAAAGLSDAAAVPPGLERCKALLRALAHDPLDGATSAELEVAILQAGELGAGRAEPALAPPLIALDARPRLTLSWLGELLECPALLAGFARHGDPDATLLVLAPSGADLAPLVRLVEGDPRLTDEACDIQVMTEPATTPARALLAARARDRLSTAPARAGLDRLPAHPAVGIDAAALAA
jgi:glycosyltransferase involved in cell wall biosynthesis